MSPNDEYLDRFQEGFALYNKIIEDDVKYYPPVTPSSIPSNSKRKKLRAKRKKRKK